MPKIPPIKKSNVVVRTKKSMVRVKDGMVIVSTVFYLFFYYFKSKPVKIRAENESGQKIITWEVFFTKCLKVLRA